MASICVFCASSVRLEQSWLDLATDAGTEIGRRGHTLVSGGGCVGMMGAVADGARAAGARTVGIIPQSLVDAEVADMASDELIVTSSMAERKTIMVDKSDAFVVLAGGLGTLDELFEVWTLATLRLHDKPIVVVDTDGFYSGLADWLRGLVPLNFVREEGLSMLFVAPDVRSAFDVLEETWTQSRLSGE
jgi:uncharacterized protein (TIGR00730 family)